jgi:ElaB/YqjD/DUF883 family membrane-anchored ribosome-binding protein
MAQLNLSKHTNEILKKASNLGHQVQKIGKDTIDFALNNYERGKASVHKVETTAQNKIRKKPITSVMIAAGAGLVLGSLFTIKDLLMGKKNKTAPQTSKKK